MESLRITKIGNNAKIKQNLSLASPKATRALGKVCTNSKAFDCALLTVRGSSSDRPPLALIKSFLKIRMMEASHIRPVPDRLKPRIMSESKPLYSPHRCVLDDRNCCTDFRQEQQQQQRKKAAKERKTRQHGSLFKDEDITDLEP
ncbi:uncharacterized protein LOC117892076 [Drosophila subobscura]|uniref:uncharacterized protein LOC117892076 n=1 Tax=Drosophila subobscura TaxID=7241 RepID=UPI00155A9DF3|nr:uncharacterized protein LOC117892076 [Drosophila subobscura]